jgi:hypothetical protein
MPDWQVVGVVFEGEPIDVKGVNPWGLPWHLIDETPVMLPHRSYPHQLERFFIWEVDSETGKISFAATELSANVWGFYVRST